MENKRRIAYDAAFKLKAVVLAAKEGIPAFKVALRVQWEAWMTSGEKSFTNTGRMRKATFAQVCQWILTAWKSVKTSTITNGFRKAGLLRDEEEGAATADEALQRMFDSDTDEEEFVGFESDNEGEGDEAILGLFVSDTEEEDFVGFSTEEEDEDEDK